MRKRVGWHDAYDAQMGVWRWERSGPGLAWLGESYRYNVASFDASIDERTIRLFQQLYETDANKLLGADPIYVSEEMVDVVEAAYPEFAPEPLFVTDLPTAVGFLYFAKPFNVLDRFGKTSTIRAASWTPILGENLDAETKEEEDAALAAVQQAAAEAFGLGGSAMLDWLSGREGHADGVALTLYADPKPEAYPKFLGPPPPILPMHLTPWYFAMTFEGNEVDGKGIPTAAETWWRILQTTFRLMQQKLSHRASERPERHQRRDGIRRGFPERDVVVVRLRREAADREPGESEPANYSHRFIVGGHWRNQWYPSSQTHRQIYISPYVKGDESLPLVVRPKRAFSWTR